MKNKIIYYKNIALGLFLFSIGLFKKVVIADTFALWAIQGFDKATVLTLFEAWATSLSYTFQLYFDFSAYTDIAIGVSLLFNIKLPINFNSPYKATNIQDFWKRWHITLSRFLRDYIYIPLGGNRQGHFRTYSNLMMTFLIGGLWHGAGWTFIFWGFLHGFALIVHRFWQLLGGKFNVIIAWIITFNFINISWIFFRAKEWSDAIKVLRGMCGLSGIVLPNMLSNTLTFLVQYGIKFGGLAQNIGGHYSVYTWLSVGFILVLMFKNSMSVMNSFALNYKTVLFSSALFIYAIYDIFILKDVSEFLYFNF